MDKATLLAKLRCARAQARPPVSGKGQTVLDGLVSGETTGEVLDALLRHTGIAGVLDPRQARALLAWDALATERARELQCVPLLLRGEANVRIGMADPWDDAQLRKVTRLLGRVPELAAVGGAALEACLSVDTMSDPASAKEDVDHRHLETSSSRTAAEPGVVEFVAGALQVALAQSASDIHFECDRAGVSVKLRQDGVLTPWQRLDGTKRAEEVVSRIKVLAQLDITERRVPQDGRFRWHSPGRASGGIDLRVSIMPSIHGEDAVLRLLDKAQLRLADQAHSLDALGFDGLHAQRIRDLAALPHGMLLVTGPTGSGKTTTVYATLSEINNGLEKIVTIEDPVEYELPGVLQIPVNERKGLTFAKGLRSILRHDPDRILVGEIRDAETAEIAVQSALTGHQVFTTVHANSIFDVVGRFRHFGLDMFGFMSSLNGVIVQRLLRRLCRSCALARPASEPERAWLGIRGRDTETPGEVWRAVGCTECRSTGYRGRLVVAEVHGIDDRLRDLVTSGAAMSLLREHVNGQASATLAQQGAQLIRSGATTIEEVRRVVG